MARSPVAEGALRALTLAPGIIPIGILFGAAAAAVGLSPAAATALSAFVFAGGAQFAAIGLVATGAALLPIVALVAIVNSRYFLLSAATLDLARRAGATRFQRILLALGVVDESYALQAAWVKERTKPTAEGGPFTASAASPVDALTDAPIDARAEKRITPSASELDMVPVAGLLAVPLVFWAMWVGSTLVGALIGERVPDLEPFGLDYALPGIFVGLLGIFADTRPRLIAGLTALAVAGALALAGYGTLAVLVVPPLMAFGLGRWAPRAG